ncbi:MAG: ATP-binding protein [Lachnospiraceae bacterium]|nr:ATP-binding protein [Lachnospiraceae bacterium]
MKNNCIVRILTTELWHFKNIGYGKIDYSGCHSARWNAAVSEQDITGLYGQNGSGKTALIEAMDIVRFILMGREIPYEEYAGLIGVEENTVISAEFFVATGYGRKYKATYEVSLKAVKDKKRILLVSEKLLFRKWMSSWSAKSSLLITGVHRVTEERCDSGVIPEKKTVVVRAKPVLYAERTGLDQCFRNVAGYCVQKNVSIFFNRLMLNAKRGKTHDGGFAPM